MKGGNATLETALTRAGIRAHGVPEGHATERAVERSLVADFDRVVREHQRRIYRVLFGVLRDADAADTLTQECFLRAWQRRESFRGESTLGTWLTRIAVNLAIDHQRNRRAGFWRRLFASQQTELEQTAALERAPDRAASQERVLVAREQASRVWEIAGKLPMQQRTIFVLRFAEEQSLDEIADAMGLQVGTVKAHLFRAVQTVRQRVGSRE